MLIALPNIDGTFASILFLPFDGADSFAGLTTPAQVEDVYKRQRLNWAARMRPSCSEIATLKRQ